MRARLIQFAALAALAVLFSGAGQQETAAPLRVAVPASVSSIPVLALDGTEAAGRKIAVTIFQDHSLTLAQFLKGDVDVLMTGFTQGAAAFAAHKDVRLLATPVWGVSSIVVRDPAWKRLEDLAGKSVLVPFARSPLDLQTRAVLKAKDLSDRVRIEFAPPQQAAALLLAGRADAIAVPEPLPSQLTAGGRVFRLARCQDLWAEIANGEPRSPQVSLFVLAGFAAGRRGLVRAFVAAAAASTRAVNADPRGAARKHAAAFQLEAGLVEEGLANTLFDLPDRALARRLSDDFAARVGLDPIDPAFYAED